MTDPHTLRCLGRPALIGPDGRPVRLRTRKHLALLIYLAVESRVAHRRERLVELLWPRATTGEGRHSLSTALSVLRAKLGRAAINSSREHVQLILADLELDLHRLTEGRLLETDLLPALEVGGFLEDFDIPGAPEFALWRDQERAHWLPQIRDALLFMIDRCRRTGDFVQIEGFADRMLTLDDLSEDGMRAKMEARAFAGDRLTALRLFEEWKERLLTELGAEPSPLIEGMAIRLRRRGWERSNTKEIALVPTDQWKGRRFVGRAQEYAILYEAWESTVNRSPHHILVVGDSGVGKSTLVDRLATAACLSGGVSSRVQCYDLEHEIPYTALSNILHGLITLPGASATSPDALAELSRTAPRVREHFQSIPTPTDSQGENSRVRLADAVQQLVCSVAEEQPVMLVVDDFHLADDASISVIHLLLRRLEQNRVMVLLTARIGELGRSPNANRLQEAQERLNLTTTGLPPLSNGESAELITTLVSPDESVPKGAMLQALIRAGAGFPMALELLIEDWRLNGDRCLALSLEAMTEEPLADSTPGDAYRKLLGRLSMRLDSTTRNVLNLAALLGPRMNDLDMYALMDLTLGQSMGAMSKLTELRILRDGTHGLEFVNELIRAQVYLTIPSPLRRTLHGRIADRLLLLGEQVTQAAGLEIAWHCVRAGWAGEATPYLLQGAKAALRRGAPYEAERALASAIDRLEDPEKSEAVIQLARALNDQGKFSESLSLLERSHPFFSEDHSYNGRILILHSKLMTLRESPIEDSRRLRQLLTIARGAESIPTRAHAIGVAAKCLPENETPSLDRELLKELSDLDFEELEIDDRQALAFARARIFFRMKDFDSSQREIATALQAQRCHGLLDSATGARLLSAEAILLSCSGKYEEAMSSYKEAWAIASRLDDDFLCVQIAGNTANASCRLADFQKQLEWGLRGLKLSISLNSPIHVVQSCDMVALAYAFIGNTEDALVALREGDRLLSKCQDVHLQQAWSLSAADVLRICERHEEALDRATTVHSASNSTFQFPNLVGKYSRWLAICGIEKPMSVATTELSRMFEQRDNYDRLDQIEILSSIVWFDHRRGQEDPENRETLRSELETMPSGVTVLLGRLGMLTY